MTQRGAESRGAESRGASARKATDPRRSNPRRSDPRRSNPRRGERRRAEKAQQRAELTAAQLEERQRIRRIIMIGLGAVLILIVAFVVFAYAYGKVTERQEAVLEKPDQLYQPTQCTNAMLKASLAMTGAVAGSPSTFHVNLTNTSEDNPCFIDVGWKNLTVEITSGGAHVSDTGVCQVGPQSNILLLDRQMSATYDVAWTGTVSGKACATNGDWARPGTYQARAILNGNIELGTLSFEIRPAGSRPQTISATSEAISPVESASPSEGETPAEGENANDGASAPADDAPTPVSGASAPAEGESALADAASEPVDATPGADPTAGSAG
ncbi:hypothetical protein [Actinobaculum massiliense]|nr:hypothetical protein [Actinobaculum massiliense]MDK8319926.1 hypothetical protein [Actinobaculum massiliense]MDK8567602.1 hypothetical protein [Actinobaculum massiliense]